MPRFTIDLSTRTVTALQAILTTYNANTGRSLTLQEWILQNLHEIATNAAVGAAAESLRQQAEADLQLAITATRDRLITELDA